MAPVVFVCAVVALVLFMGAFASVLLMQRRRHRRLLALALAAEEAERRRAKKRKSGLKGWEIDAVCPECIVDGVVEAEEEVELVKEVWTVGVDGEEELLSALDRELSSPDVCAPAPAAVPGEAEEGGIDIPVKAVEAVEAGEAIEAIEAVEEELALLRISIAEGDETCVVCLDDMKPGDRVRRLPCTHTYHSSCIRVWLRRKNACPCCCVSVIKRRKKRRRHHDNGPNSSNEQTNTATAPDPGSVENRAVAEGEVSASDVIQPESGPSSFAALVPSALAVHNERSVSEHSLSPSARARLRPADRTGETIIDINALGARGIGVMAGIDRPRPPILHPPGSFPRTGSLLDPDDPNSEVLNSEASSHFDEPMAAVLLEHVRRVLRGEASTRSLDTSVDGDSTDGDIADQSQVPGQEESYSGSDDSDQGPPAPAPSVASSASLRRGAAREEIQRRLHARLAHNSLPLSRSQEELADQPEPLHPDRRQTTA